jgi:diamine N-acetyltransferase
MTPVFRNATPDDITAIIALQEQIWEPTYRSILTAEQIDYMFRQTYAPEALRDQMHRQGHTFVLVYRENNLVGFTSFSESRAADHQFKLHKLYVLPSEQGQGTGRKLLEEVIRQCRQKKGQQLLLNVNRHNKALQFYERMGFTIIREEDIPIGPYWMNDYVMALDLVPR